MKKLRDLQGRCLGAFKFPEYRIRFGLRSDELVLVHVKISARLEKKPS